eukprot:8580121-Pyramimonas_sp.AAC.1
MRDDAEKATRGGWIIPGGDPVTGAADLYGVYEKAQPRYIGRCAHALPLAERRTPCPGGALVVGCGASAALGSWGLGP